MAVVECVGDKKAGGGILKPAVGAKVGVPLVSTACMSATWVLRCYDEATLHCVVHASLTSH